MKLFLRFILSLCFLLAGGYTYLDAHTHTHQDSVRYSAITNLEKANQVSLETFKNSPLLSIRSAPSVPEQDQEKMEVSDDDEDDDESSFKKQVVRDTHIASQLYARPPTYCFHCNYSGIPTGMHFAYLSSDRYILFRVFRI